MVPIHLSTYPPIHLSTNGVYLHPYTTTPVARYGKHFFIGSTLILGTQLGTHFANNAIQKGNAGEWEWECNWECILGNHFGNRFWEHNSGTHFWNTIQQHILREQFIMLSQRKCGLTVDTFTKNLIS